MAFIANGNRADGSLRRQHNRVSMQIVQGGEAVYVHKGCGGCRGGKRLHSPGRAAEDAIGIPLLSEGGDVVLSANTYGEGRGVYLNGFSWSFENARLLYRALLWAAKREELDGMLMPEDPACECAYFIGSKKLVVLNGENQEKALTILTPDGERRVSVPAGGISVVG